ncbi:hypothetical protein MESS2_710002 [Mesorhizobium metallidurans STM 2683]|uniref:Uncharacterized protein n=1 Tax=Mesorhizobium metallidurans STM 2683 TaxID=1297569 RepID=M5EVP5_9HYPH|nr:hypothetical protein MESS2_710002 [Mesorhizobium metallidurans STM 2683]
MGQRKPGSVATGECHESLGIVEMSSGPLTNRPDGLDLMRVVRRGLVRFWERALDVPLL